MTGENLDRTYNSSARPPHDEYLSARDEDLGELFRSFLPEEIANMPFDFLVDVALGAQGSEFHGRMVRASGFFLEVVNVNLCKEIAKLKKG